MALDAFRNMMNSKRNAMEKELRDNRVDAKHGIGKNRNILDETNPVNKFGLWGYTDNGVVFTTGTAAASTAATESAQEFEAEVPGTDEVVEQGAFTEENALYNDETDSDKLDEEIESQDFNDTSVEDIFNKSLSDLNVSQLKEVEELNGLDTSGKRADHEARLLEHFSWTGNDDKAHMQDNVDSLRDK